MPDIRHRVVMDAPAERVYEAASTAEGISQWWTRDGVRGESAEGATLEFRFGNPEPGATVEITRLEAPNHIAWRCVQGPADWVGTDLTFDLSQDEDGRTVVIFAHSGWGEQSDFMAHCSARWAYFLLSLKGLVEQGAGTPHPEDLRF